MAEKNKRTLRKKKLGSYPYVSVVFSIILALFVIGIFGLLLIYSQKLEQSVRSNIKIQVYLKNHLSDTDKTEVRRKIEQAYFLPKTERSQAIEFFSKEESAKQFIKETGEDFKKFLGDNPLRDAYLVKVDPVFHDPESMRKVKGFIEKIPGVFQAYYVENLIKSINDNVTKISFILLAISAILLITIVLLINNTLRLALFSQRFLIRSMQLVGAKKWFIQKPFLFRALFHGFLAGLIASFLLVLIIYFASKRIDELHLLQDNRLIVLLLLSLVLVGISIATLSTYRAVNKYLKLSLDELY